MYPFSTYLQTCYNAWDDCIEAKNPQNSKTPFFCPNIQNLQNHCQLIFGSCVLYSNTSNTSYTSYQSYPSPCPGSVTPVSAFSIFKLEACSLTCAEISSYPQSKLSIGIDSGNFKEAQTILRPPLKSLHCST